ncbi:MAG: ribose-5-phosphate isomerase RpiA [Candidatus Bathyarchaeota archaeon]|nr:ribose-5-phosphate isomerase RpiA [Candidatus Bathyarchaeota archaeon]
MKPENTQLEQAKQKAAQEAIKHIKNNHIVGLGSGSTAAYAIKTLSQKIRNEKLNILAIPTSYQAFLLAVKHGITITTLEEHPTIDVTIDGADQIDPHLNLIKGMGAALTREKIVASATKQNIIIADHTKKVQTLGENNHPVPIEVIPFALTPVNRKIQQIGGNPTIRETKGKLGPVITDNGNAIIDATFGPINNPKKLEQTLKTIPGIVETGLFLNTTNIAYITTNTTTEKIERKQKTT